MPSDRTTLETNATWDLDRLNSLGVTHFRIWVFREYGMREYTK